jgi:hypothetical protein
MVNVIITWNSQFDGRVCGKCLLLSDYKWTFKETLPSVLVHPTFGVVWDLTVDESRAHGLSSYNCRCFLTYEFDDSDVTQLLNDTIDRKHKLEDNLDVLFNSVSMFRSVR